MGVLWGRGGFPRDFGPPVGRQNNQSSNLAMESSDLSQNVKKETLFFSKGLSLETGKVIPPFEAVFCLSANKRT